MLLLMVLMLLMISELEVEGKRQWKVSLYRFPYCEHLKHSQISCKLSVFVLSVKIDNKTLCWIFVQIYCCFMFYIQKTNLYSQDFHHFHHNSYIVGLNLSC